MKQKLIPLLLFLVAIVTGAKASTVDDLVAISSDYTFIADAVTDNGTTKLTANTLYADGHIFTSTGNSVATNKGSSTFGGASHLNSLRIKNTQDVLAFKVSKACTVTFYTQSHGSRGLKVGTTNGGNEYGSQTTGTSTYEVDVNAGVVYLSSFEGDFYIAGFVVTFPSATTKPTFTTDLSATADVTVGVAETFTVATDNATSYQWYVGGTAVDGATSASYEYTATEAGDVEIYCAATNSVGTTNSTTCTVTATAPASAPTITTDLESAYNVYKGSTLELSIVAENASSYQWYLDDQPIDGATTASYTFSGTTKDATNEVYCAVTNAAGTTNSNTATITTQASSINTIASLTADGTALTATGTTYSAKYVDHAATVAVVVTPTDANATVKIGDNEAAGAGEAAEANVAFGSTTITVTAENGDEAEYTLTLTNYESINVSGNKYVVANGDVVYDGINVNCTDIKMTYGTSAKWNAPQAETSDAGKAALADLTDDPYLVTGGSNPSVSSNIPTSGVFYKFVPTSAGTLYVGIKNNANKNLFVVEDGTSIGYKVNDVSYDAGSTTGSDVLFGMLKFPVKANSTYYVYCTGSKLTYYGFDFQPKAARTFTDFEISFIKDWASASTISGGTTYYVTEETDGVPTTATEEPSSYLATFSGQYHGTTYGLRPGYAVSFAVDGPVTISIGTSDYGNDVVVKNSDNETVTSGSAQGNKYAVDGSTMSLTYNSETATTLTVSSTNGYLPYIAVAACDLIENCTVTYYDADGTTILATDEVEGSSALAYNAEATAAVAVGEGQAFRGWFNGKVSSASKVAEGTAINEDLKLYAKVTDIEVAEVGKIYNYDLRKANFYEEDHELFSATSHTYNGAQHGWAFTSGNSFSVQVAGNAQIVVGLCAYAANAPITVTDANNVGQGTIASAKVDTDGATSTFNYTGEATTLTFTMGGTAYIHGVQVYNVSSIPTKDEATGYYIVESGDAAGLILAINSASAEGNAKIFLPNGIYDLGETTLTTISGNNVSIIGESKDGVIIKNRPVKEGIAITATLLNTATGTYMQDLTLDCIAPYGTGDDTPTAERGVCLQDKGNQTICKNVYLKGLQDSYYSNNNSGTFYFEDSKIEGTVDFLCGNGDVYFNNTLLKVVARSTGSGSANVIAAPNTPKSFGYIFYDCTIDGISAQDNVYRLGRPWADNTIIRMINTTMMIKPVSTGWDEWSSDVSKQHYVQQFAEYNSVDEKGNAVSLNSRLTTIGGQPNNPVITEAEAASYTKEAVFGSTSWVPYEIAAQATVVKTSVVNNVVTVPEGIYLVEKDGQFVEIFNGTSYTYDNTGKYTLRMANERGGFGEAVEMISGAAAPVQDGETITLTVSANMNGYRAYVNTESNYTVDENTQVYLPVSKTNNEVNLEPIDIAVVPANMPVILVTSADANVDGTYTITLTTTDADATAINTVQYLQLTEAGVAVSGYRLGYKASSGVKFYKYVASNPEAGKIYLNMADLPEGTPSADALQIEFEQEATGVNEINAAEAVVDGKFIKAGKLVIKKAGKAFNAAGAVLK